MGMYVCHECLKEHGLGDEIESGRFTTACCEICLPLKGDETQKALVWVWRPKRNTQLDMRLMRLDVQDQLARLKAERETDASKCIDTPWTGEEGPTARFR